MSKNSFHITDPFLIERLDSLTPQELERLNEILEESMNELREKYKIKTGSGFDEPKRINHESEN